MPFDTPISDLLAPERVAVHLDAPDKDAAIRALVDLTADAPAVLDAARLLADVLAREATMSTGVGDGLGLPHARTPAVSETVLALATLARPVGFDALDGRPVSLLVLLAGPEGDHAGHVRLLSRLSRVLATPGVREALVAAETPEAALDALREAEARGAEAAPAARR